MSVVVSVQDVGPCRKQLTVEVPAPAVEAEVERVVREFGGRIRIPGFRKGKVPAEMVRRRFGKDIDREVIDRLVPRYWRQAQAESSIEPLLPPDVEEVPEIRPGLPLTFVATVETRPQIEIRNIRDFALPDPPVEPSPMEVEEALEDLRRQLADWVPVERPAGRGDLVSGDVVEILPAEDREGEPGHFEVEVGDPRVWEELSLALSGLAAGQEARFTRQFPGAEGQEGDQGGGAGPGAALGNNPGLGSDPTPPRHFRASVTAVKERELPDLDDDFATRVGPELKTVDDLREAVGRKIRGDKIEHRSTRRQEALLDQLRERHPLELPAGVVQREVEHLLEEYARTLERRGVDLDRANVDWERLGGDMTPLAEKRVHARLVLDAISEAEGVVVPEPEFEAFLAAIARAQNTTTPALRKSLDEGGRLTSLRGQLRRDKTIRHLLGEDRSAAEPAAASEG